MTMVPDEELHAFNNTTVPDITRNNRIKVALFLNNFCIAEKFRKNIFQSKNESVGGSRFSFKAEQSLHELSAGHSRINNVYKVQFRFLINPSTASSSTNLFNSSDTVAFPVILIDTRPW